VSESLGTVTGRSVGVRDIPVALLVPRRVFARVEDVAVWRWPLLVLLAAVTLIGYATVQTGLIDRQIDGRVRDRLAQIDREQHDVLELSALRDMYEEERKKGEFEKLLARIQVVVAEPVSALAWVLLIAAVLYGVVALTGRKPEWHTLLTVCVFAAFIDVLRLLMTLALRLRYGTLEVDTSLALLTRFLAKADGADPLAVAALSGLLSALDPFRVWFWLAVIVGLSATTQLRGWRVWLTCSLCWLTAAGARSALAVAAIGNVTSGGAGGG
jgi:hypothetical protein